MTQQPNPGTSYNQPNIRRKERRPSSEELTTLLQRLNIQQWDVLLVGDGSGTGWNAACGWAATLVDRRTSGRRVFYGGMNSGTIYLAEAMPYMQALSWYDAEIGKPQLAHVPFLNVHIVTDSKPLAEAGNVCYRDQHGVSRNNIAFLAFLKEMRLARYNIVFHWLGRMSCELNWMADIVASAGRISVNEASFEQLQGITEATHVANTIGALQPYDPYSKQLLDPYTCNPLRQPPLPTHTPVAIPTNTELSRLSNNYEINEEDPPF